MSAYRHPTLWSLAQHLREIAAVLDDNGNHSRSEALVGRCRCLECSARLLAARGWPEATTGDGSGSRGADTTSSTERAVVDPPLPMFTDIDNRLAKSLYLMWQVGLKVQTDARNILAHAEKDDALPAGSGECARCGRFCRPDQRQGDRIRSGYCGACYRLWLRRGKPERSAFSREGETTEQAA